MRNRPYITHDENLELPTFIRQANDDEVRESLVERERRHGIMTKNALRQMLFGTSLCGGATGTLLLEISVANPHPVVAMIAVLTGLLGFYKMDSGAEQYVAALRTYEDFKVK